MNRTGKEMESPGREIRRHWRAGGIILAACVMFLAFSLPAGAAQDGWQLNLPPAMKGAKYVGSSTCEMCHEGHYKSFKLSAHYRIKVKDASGKIVQGCELCHGPGSIHSDASGGTNNILNPKNDPSICFQCHLDKEAQFHLPYHHPVLEGRMSCTSCHKIHGPDRRPWTSTSMDDVNQVCFKCHKQQEGPFVWSHDALKEGCTTCHQVHGSVNDKMLISRDANLCLRCHAQVLFPTIGGSNHHTRLPEGTCWSAGCHTAVHGSNFDVHLRY